MNRRKFLKGLGAITALTATGIEAKAMVPPYPWPGEPTADPVEGTDCGKDDLIPGLVYYDLTPDGKIINRRTHKRYPDAG